MNRSTQYKKLINSRKWVKLRTEKLRTDPLCERCKQSGIITPGAEVHHITPVDNGSTPAEKKRLAYNVHNLQTLCRSCHVETHKELQSKSKQAAKRRAKDTAAAFAAEFLSVKK